VGCQLPPAVEEFVGRTAQLEVLTGLLTGGGYGSGSGVCVAAVSGLPGGGKTAFALQAAHRSRAAFPDGQLFASLESAGGEPRDPAGVLADLLAGLGVPPAALPAGLSERAALYRARLTDRRVLVVLDDAASAAQVGWLLPGTAGCAVVAASRRRIADLPGASLVDLDPLSRPEALRLFTGIVGADRVCGQQEAAVEIVEACGRLPATLRAAAVRAAVLPALPLDWLRQRLLDRHRLDELAAGGADLRTSVHRSLRVLCPAAQRAFRRIGLLDSGEITPALVAAVLGGEDPLPAVEGLLNAGLLRFAGVDPDGLRYRMPEIIFHCARELASRDPGAEWEAAAVRHLAGMAGVLRPPLAVEGPAPLGWRPAGPAGP
jgi:hypothetical protein